MIDGEGLRAAVVTERHRRRRSAFVLCAMLSAMLSPAGYAMATLSGWRGTARFVVAGVTALMIVLALFGAIRLVQWVSSGTLLAFFNPGGYGRPTSVYSHAEALAATGKPNDAANAFEALRIRRVKAATVHDERYATHRLIDLYVGPLNDNGRVMVELRRMADRFPNTVDGRSALAELRRRRESDLEQGEMTS